MVIMSQQAAYIEKWIGYLNDVDHEMSLIAAKKLANVSDPQVVAELINSLTGRPDDVRVASARSLGKIGDRRAVKPLVDMMKDSNPLISSAAADALGAIGDASAVPALVGILHDYKTGNSRHYQLHGFNRGLFMAAVYALERINTPEARRAVDKYHR